jgi:uncharacterized membrane protein YraQ (UPF0718 family)
MLRAMLGGFLLGPIVLVVVALLWSKAAVLVAVILLMLFALLVIAVIAGAIAGGTAKARRNALTDAAALTALSPPASCARQENLASRTKWRQDFMAWRYTLKNK